MHKHLHYSTGRSADEEAAVDIVNDELLRQRTWSKREEEVEGRERSAILSVKALYAAEERLKRSNHATRLWPY